MLLHRGKNQRNVVFMPVAITSSPKHSGVSSKWAHGIDSTNQFLCRCKQTLPRQSVCTNLHLNSVKLWASKYSTVLEAIAHIGTCQPWKLHATILHHCKQRMQDGKCSNNAPTEVACHTVMLLDEVACSYITLMVTAETYSYRTCVGL